MLLKYEITSHVLHLIFPYYRSLHLTSVEQLDAWVVEVHGDEVLQPHDVGVGVALG